MTRPVPAYSASLATDHCVFAFHIRHNPAAFPLPKSYARTQQPELHRISKAPPSDFLRRHDVRRLKIDRDRAFFHHGRLQAELGLAIAG